MTWIQARLRGRDSRRDDAGFAMVAVIGLMAVGALIIAVMVTATISTVGWTTASRANVQAKAAAQAGLDRVHSDLDNKNCAAGPGGKVSGTLDDQSSYSVTIHWVTGGTATSSSPSGCPGTGATSILLVAEGTASASGVTNESGNKAAMEAYYQRSVTPPTFNAAVYGYNSISLNTGLEVTDTSATNSGDVTTGGNFVCSTNMIIEGKVVALGNATFSSAPCRVKGSVIIGGDFECAAGTTIEGDLDVTGNARFTSPGCDVKGTVTVGGNVYMSTGGTPMGSALVVGGNLGISGLPAESVLNIAVHGALVDGDPASSGPGSFTTDLKERMGDRLTIGVSVPSPEPVPDNLADGFPKIDKADSMFAGWISKSWKSTVEGLVSPSHGDIKSNVCSLQQWQDNAFTQSVVISANTIFDTTSASECGNSGLILGDNITFELKADAVIFASSFKQNGAITVKSGDGKKHVLYLIVPWPSGGAKCDATTTAIRLESGTWNQPTGNLASVVFYGFGNVEVATTPAIYGQLYGCSVQAATGTKIFFTPPQPVTDIDTLPWSNTFVKDM